MVKLLIAAAVVVLGQIATQQASGGSFPLWFVVGYLVFNQFSMYEYIQDLEYDLFEQEE